MWTNNRIDMGFSALRAFNKRWKALEGMTYSRSSVQITTAPCERDHTHTAACADDYAGSDLVAATVSAGGGGGVPGPRDAVAGDSSTSFVPSPRILDFRVKKVRGMEFIEPHTTPSGTGWTHDGVGRTDENEDEKPDRPKIRVGARSWLAKEHQSHSNKNIFEFEVQITNLSERSTVKLLRRHWDIREDSGKKWEVSGDGVLGKTPTLLPGHSFSYKSYSHPLESSLGTMVGKYEFLDIDQAQLFDVRVGPFGLLANEEDDGCSGSGEGDSNSCEHASRSRNFLDLDCLK
eukprot:TRINITY_DN6641_c0_g1_i2.p1 TRINITY_DN6641_c0_g1~~TRINITY_DN6641_c0_g1_i2.p1  ORF type:complete len:290 (+),score=30.25 TRINITY_DN6641_c0_g1_i2:644-1513(+)